MTTHMTEPEPMPEPRPARLHARPHPAPLRTDKALSKLHTRLLQMGTWRYLRYMHLRASLLEIADEIATVGIVGAGHGIAEVALALEFPHIHFTLTDAQFDGYPIYDGAQDICWQWGIDNVAFSVWNVLQPTARRFDLVASTEVLEHIEDATTAAARMREAALRYVYCLVPFADAAENARSDRRAYVLERHGHFVAGFDAQTLEALFPDPVHIKGAYFRDAGRVLRETLIASDAATIAARAPDLLALARTDLRDDLPATSQDGQGIRILSRAPATRRPRDPESEASADAAKAPGPLQRLKAALARAVPR